MARNQKLTAVIAGRKMAFVEREGAVLIIRFTDGSIMSVRSATEAEGVPMGVVAAVRQRDTSLEIDLQEGETASIETEEATSCVLLRDQSGTLEYAD